MPIYLKSSVFTSKVLIEVEKSAAGKTSNARGSPVSASESSYSYGPHRFGSGMLEVTIESVH